MIYMQKSQTTVFLLVLTLEVIPVRTRQLPLKVLSQVHEHEQVVQLQLTPPMQVMGVVQLRALPSADFVEAGGGRAASN